jgi:hypothetical protein
MAAATGIDWLAIAGFFIALYAAAVTSWKVLV